MAKPTPLKTAGRSISTAQSCIEKILVGSNANGKYIKIGSDTRNDVAVVIKQLEELKDSASYLTESIRNLLECVTPQASEGLKARMASLSAKQALLGQDVVFTDLPPVISEVETNNSESTACTI
jgi:hypothetical protein